MGVAASKFRSGRDARNWFRKQKKRAFSIPQSSTSKKGRMPRSASALMMGNHGKDDKQQLLSYENHDILRSYDDSNIDVVSVNQDESGIMEAHGLGEDHSLDYLHVVNPAHGLGEEHTLDHLHEESTAIHHLVVTPIFCQLPTSLNHQMAVGQESSNVECYRSAPRDNASASHFGIQTIKSEKIQSIVKCEPPDSPTSKIRTINDSHTCNEITSVQRVADIVDVKLLEMPQLKPKSILEEIRKAHGITLPYDQACRWKERSMTVEHQEAYQLLPQYCDQIRRTNPGSIALVYKKSEDNCFHRLFISYYALIYGFANCCRPFIALDRIQLKSKYLGMMLIAAAFDAEGAMFPLAFGVVEESGDNWTWFLSELRMLITSNTEKIALPRLTFMSSRVKSIMLGLEINFPTAFHVFRQEFDNALMNLLGEATQALTASEFEAKMSEIQLHSPCAASWVRGVPLSLWVAAYFEETRFGHHIAESLNSLLLKALRLPPVQMLERIRWKLMTWFNMRRKLSMKWPPTMLVPSAERKLSCAEELAKGLQVTPRENEAETFEVLSPNGRTSVVDIRNRVCCCQGWQVDGLPCVHAAAALGYCGENARKFVEYYFTVATYRKTYSQTINPIPKKSLRKELREMSEDGDGDRYRLKSLCPLTWQSKKRVRGEDGDALQQVQ